MILTRTGEAKGAMFYQGDDGKKYQIRQVDRSYEGRAKPPVFYLERLEAGKPKYLSGMFRTKEKGLYSLDLRDEDTGMRVLYDAHFWRGGETVEIVRKGKQKVAV